MEVTGPSGLWVMFVGSLCEWLAPWWQLKLNCWIYEVLPLIFALAHYCSLCPMVKTLVKLHNVRPHRTHYASCPSCDSDCVVSRTVTGDGVNVWQMIACLTYLISVVLFFIYFLFFQCCVSAAKMVIRFILLHWYQCQITITCSILFYLFFKLCAWSCGSMSVLLWADVSLILTHIKATVGLTMLWLLTIADGFHILTPADCYQPVIYY